MESKVWWNVVFSVRRRSQVNPVEWRLKMDEQRAYCANWITAIIAASLALRWHRRNNSNPRATLPLPEVDAEPKPVRMN